MKLTGLLDQVSICYDDIRSLFNSGWLGFNNGEGQDGLGHRGEWEDCFCYCTGWGTLSG